MSTTLTPPPVLPPSTNPTGSAPRQPRSTSRAIAIIAMVLGGVLIAGTILSGVFTAIRAASSGTETFTTPVSGIDSLDVDVTEGSLEITYGDVTEAELTVTGITDDWALETEGSVLRVTSDEEPFGFNFGSWFDSDDEATLVLPSALADTELDADLTVSAGLLSARGTFGELDLHLSAGRLEVAGSAVSVDTRVSAGSTSLDLSDVSTGTFTVSAGNIGGSISGAAPDELRFDVNAGRIDLDLPDETYAISSDVSAGGFSHDLTTSPDSAHTIRVDVSAGDVRLSPVQ